jgi:lipoprotein-anchoring transpeptidase ErfK/SrfK
MKRKSKHYHKKNSSMFFISVVISLIIVLVVCVISYQFLITNEVQCANTISCKSPPKFETETNATGTFNGHPIHVPNISLAKDESMNTVLGTETSIGDKHIYVNLTTQTLSAYEGDALFMQTPVSTGLWGRTPKGDFTIWTKIRATRMSGGSGSDYYDLPNVPYVMFFSNNEVAASRGFSIHGTYWHNNFGHAMSHGCVNMKTTDVAKLFEWADGPQDGKRGTTITIYDEPSP